MPRHPSAQHARLVPAKAAAEETGIAYTTLRDLVFRGELPVLKIGRAWYLDRADLARFIDSHKERLT
jgi:excisionase family DNA binding protein